MKVTQSIWTSPTVIVTLGALLASEALFSSPVLAMWQDVKKAPRKKKEQPQLLEESKLVEGQRRVDRSEHTGPKKSYTDFRFEGKKVPKVIKSYEDYALFRDNYLSDDFRLEYPVTRNQLEILSLENIKTRANAKLKPAFLSEISTHLDHSDDHLPNVATYSIYFQIFGPGIGTHWIELPTESLFVSGHRYFDDKRYKGVNHLETACEDFLDAVEKKEVKIGKLDFQDSGNKAGLQTLGKLMEQRLRDEIVSGGWCDNALDSEALIVLHMKKNLPSILEALLDRVFEKYEEAYGDRPGYSPKVPQVYLNAAVIGISSYYQSCSRCRNLVLGFQFRLKEFPEESIKKTVGERYLQKGPKKAGVIRLVTVGEKFGTLAFSYGLVEQFNHHHDRVASIRKRLDRPVQLQYGFHSFVDLVDHY